MGAILVPEHIYSLEDLLAINERLRNKEIGSVSHLRDKYYIKTTTH